MHLSLPGHTELVPCLPSKDLEVLLLRSAHDADTEWLTHRLLAASQCRGVGCLLTRNIRMLLQLHPAIMLHDFGSGAKAAQMITMSSCACAVLTQSDRHLCPADDKFKQRCF